MRLWRGRREEPRNAGFEWREIVCADEAAAKEEAERQQLLDDAAEAEWIYLHSDKTGEWLAHRTPRNLELPSSRFDPVSWGSIDWPSG